MVLSSCAVRQGLETGGSSSGSRSFSKHTALQCGNFNMLGLFFLPSNNKRKHTWGMERERKETKFTVGCFFPSQMEGKVKQKHFFAAPDTMEGLMIKRLILQPLSSELNYLVGFRVELWLNYLETHLHKVYVCEHVLEVKCLLPCTQDSIKGQE